MAKDSSTRESQHIIVTGAGTGIGRAIALRLASENARLTLLARNRERLDEVARDARAQGSSAVHIANCDIRERAQVDACIGEAAQALGPVYACVANSGIGGANAPGPDDRFDDIVLTNINGTYNCLRAAQHHLARGPEARHLVVISSILARIGVPGYTGYCASKAGLLGMVRAFAAELAGQNIQVNAVCPGWVDTEMAWSGLEGIATAMGITKEQAHANAMQAVPLARMSKPEDIAGVISWLTSPDARGVTGQGIDVNGGAFMI